MLGLDDIRLVAALADDGSARRAASRLGRHVATLYRQLAALEARVGAPLFERSSGRYLPTALGIEFIAAARSVQATLDGLDRRTAGHNDRLAGRLVVTTTDTLLALVTEAMAPFVATHPALVVELSIGNVMADMVRHDADIAVRPTIAPSDTLIGRRISEFGFARYARDPSVTGWIGFDASLAAVPMSRWLEKQADGPPRLRCNSLWAAAQAAVAGIGWTVLPMYLARTMPLVMLGEPVAALRSAVWMLYHPDMRRTPRVRYFVRDLAPRLAMLMRADAG